MSRTLSDEMAIAVLRGDKVAAYALADRLHEELHSSAGAIEEVVRERLENGTAIDGYVLYHTDEFKAFCKFLGIPWPLPTVDLVITIREGEMVRIDHSYQARIPNSE